MVTEQQNDVIFLLDIYHCDIYHIAIRRINMPRENKTKYAILGLLSFAPMSGYDIKKMTDRSIAHFWNENFGHLYPVLARMEREGLISREIHHTTGRPDRSVYTLTDTGRNALADWLVQEPEDPPTRIELLLQLFFAKGVPLSVVIEKIERERKLNESRLAVYDAIERHIREGVDQRKPADVPYWLMTLSFGKHRSRAAVAWCDETIKMLGDMQSAPPIGPSDPGSGGPRRRHDR
jgi:PadR family transcriptional regulator, regulatory protein AphA